MTDPNEAAAARSAMKAGSGAVTRVPGVQSNRERLPFQALGLPMLRAERDPFRNIPDPKQRDMARRSSLGLGEKDLIANSPEVAKAREGVALINEFEGINSRGVTGGLTGWLADKVPNFLRGDDSERMDMLTQTLAPQNRQPGTGAVSDYDAKSFLAMTGGLTKSPEVNRKFAEGSRRMNMATIERQGFREAYLQANGTLTGADDMWKQYATAEPIFDQGGQVRTDRTPWSNYFARRAQTVMSGQRLNAAPKAGQRRPMAPKGGPIPKGWSVEVVE